MHDYQPSNRVSLFGIILLLLIALLSSAALGYVMWLSQSRIHVYIPIVFPFLAGGVIGVLLILGVMFGKVRNPLFAAAVGLLAGVITYGVYHYTAYAIDFRGDARSSYVESFGEPTSEDDFERAFAAMLQSEVGASGFIGYLSFAAREGFSVVPVNYGRPINGGLALRGTVVWIYWVIEMLITGGFAALLARMQTKHPYDEEANSWYAGLKPYAYARAQSRKALIAALKAGDWQGASTLLTFTPLPFPHVEIMIKRPLNEASAQDLYLRVDIVDPNQNHTGKAQGMVTPPELDELTRAISANRN